MADDNSGVHLLTSQNESQTASTSNEDDFPEKDEEGIDIERPLYYMTSSSFPTSTRRVRQRMSDEKSISSTDSEEERKELVRINTCAIFHKLTPGRGVPHSFIGFIRQWPSLPRLVVRRLLFPNLFSIDHPSFWCIRSFSPCTSSQLRAYRWEIDTKLRRSAPFQVRMSVTRKKVLLHL